MTPRKKDYGKLALALHKKLGGKIALTAKAPLKTRDDWSVSYTPGVAAVSTHVAKHPHDAKLMTVKKNSVAVVSDGSAVLGLGNIGPLGALPVMEGKAVIFKEVAGIDAYPIVLDTQDPEKVIETVVNIAPGFGGINLEDIKAPECFYIEEEVKKRLAIPVMHDDQHGTAIVVLAALMNALKVVKKKKEAVSVTVLGAGAAGYAIAMLLKLDGFTDIRVSDSKGVVHRARTDLNPYKKKLAALPSKRKDAHTLSGAVAGSDVLIAVSGPGTVSKDMVASMADKAIVFALANPVPEIMPETAKAAGAAVVATGRSDFPNQVNNALVFPGVFRGALDADVSKITDDMKLRAAYALARLVKMPTADHVIPSVMDKKVMPAVARAVAKKHRREY